MKKRSAALLGAHVGLAALVGACSSSPPPRPTPAPANSSSSSPEKAVTVQIGKPAPALELTAWKNSKPLALAELAGKVVLIDFLAHW